jgi:hypothetical protein
MGSGTVKDDVEGTDSRADRSVAAQPRRPARAPGTWDSVGCGSCCTRRAGAHTGRTARHGRRARPCDTARWRASPAAGRSIAARRRGRGTQRRNTSATVGRGRSLPTRPSYVAAVAVGRGRSSRGLEDGQLIRIETLPCGRLRKVVRRIDRTVERPRHPGTQLTLEPLQRGAAVDVVEGRHARRGVEHPFGDRDALRHVGADHHAVGVAHVAGVARLQLIERAVERRGGARGLGRPAGSRTRRPAP